MERPTVTYCRLCVFLTPCPITPSSLQTRPLRTAVSSSLQFPALSFQSTDCLHLITMISLYISMYVYCKLLHVLPLLPNCLFSLISLGFFFYIYSTCILTLLSVLPSIFLFSCLFEPEPAVTANLPSDLYFALLPPYSIKSTTYCSTSYYWRVQSSHKVV